MKYPWVLQIGIGTKVQRLLVFSQVVSVMVATRARKRARVNARISSTDVRFTQKIIVHLKATMSCIIYNHNVTNLTILCGFCGPKTTKNSPKSKI